MKLHKHGSWYVLDCVYQDRSIPKDAGFWWNTRKHPKKWATPDLEKAYLLRDAASPELAAEMETELKALQLGLEGSRAADADITIPAPPGLEYRPFQRAGIAYALERNRTLIGDEMGLGKTIQALGYINALKLGNVLIICPASLRLNWLREAQRWLTGTDLEYYVVDNPGAIPNTADIVICNYDRLAVKGLDRNWDLIVVDECQYLKNPKAKRTKAVLGAPATKTREAVKGLIGDSKALFLTGTPLLNRPIELFSLLTALDPEDLGRAFFPFARRYCDAQQNRWGWDFSGSSHESELQNKMRSRFMVRRLKKDVLKELPPKIRQLVTLSVNGSGASVEGALSFESDAYARHAETLATAKAAADLAWASGNDEAYRAAIEDLSIAHRTAFTEISEARHRVALAKVPAFCEYAKTILEQQDKIIVFAHHRDVIAAISDELTDYGVETITGETPLKTRQQNVDRFQTDASCRIIVGSIGAMGVGLTLTAATTVLFAELDWVPANVSQAEDRAHRIGQTDVVHILHCVLDDSLDARMAQMLIDKQDVLDAVLDTETGYSVDLESKIPVIPSETTMRLAPPSKPRKPQYKDATKAHVLAALQTLSAFCDGAKAKDHMGFSRYDATIGHSLAGCTNLTDRQTWLGLQLCRKYRRQLSNWEDICNEISG